MGNSSPRFNCDCCGLCCRLIGGIPQLKQFDRGDGVCCHLTNRNLCDIYDTRPEVCNVDRMYSRFSAEMSKEQYLKAMSKSCEYLKAHFDEMRGGSCPTDEIAHELADTIPAHSLNAIANEVDVSRVPPSMRCK